MILWFMDHLSQVSYIILVLLYLKLFQHALKLIESCTITVSRSDGIATSRCLDHS